MKRLVNNEMPILLIKEKHGMQIRAPIKTPCPGHDVELSYRQRQEVKDIKRKLRAEKKYRVTDFALGFVRDLSLADKALRHFDFAGAIENFTPEELKNQYKLVWRYFDKKKDVYNKKFKTFFQKEEVIDYVNNNLKFVFHHLLWDMEAYIRLVTYERFWEFTFKDFSMSCKIIMPLTRLQNILKKGF